MKKVTEKQKHKLLGWFSQQPASVITEILESASQNFYKIRERMPANASRETIRYAAFVNAVKDSYNVEYSVRMKNPDHDLEKIINNQTEKIKHFSERREEKLARKRKSKKRDLILRHSPDIVLMRNQGLSYTAIAEYLGRYKLNVHPSYIQKLAKEYFDESD